MAQAAYAAKPDLGPEDSAGRIVFNQSDLGLILAAPGTNNIACAEADAEAIPYNAGACGWVHEGIWKAFDAVWPDVQHLTVYALVGHSEGAAGVLYLAARLCLMGRAPKVVWALEPPRTSIDDKLAQILAAHGVELHIMHHGNDIVPDLPPDVLFLTWRHPGLVTKFGKATLPIPNVEDHLLQNIIPDL